MAFLGSVKNTLFTAPKDDVSKISAASYLQVEQQQDPETLLLAAQLILPPMTRRSSIALSPPSPMAARPVVSCAAVPSMCIGVPYLGGVSGGRGGSSDVRTCFLACK